MCCLINFCATTFYFRWITLRITKLHNPVSQWIFWKEIILVVSFNFNPRFRPSPYFTNCILTDCRVVGNVVFIIPIINKQN